MIPPRQLHLLQVDLESAYRFAAEGRPEEGYAVLYFGWVLHEAEPQGRWASELADFYQQAITEYIERFQLPFSGTEDGLYRLLAYVQPLGTSGGKAQETPEVLPPSKAIPPGSPG